MLSGSSPSPVGPRAAHQQPQQVAGARAAPQPAHRTRPRPVPRRTPVPPQQLDDAIAAIPTVEDLVGHTPLVRLTKLPAAGGMGPSATILAKLEGYNPAGSAKDRPALHMLREAERRGRIRPGDTIIEATSGNTGIALAMAAAVKGYRLKLILPAASSEERKATMAAFGAEVILAPSMEGARDMLKDMELKGLGHCLDQYNNPDNTASHFASTGPEIWEQTSGRVTHLICTCGTYGTVMGTGGYLKSRNPNVQVIGVQPAADDPTAGLYPAAPGSALGGSSAGIPGIRRWPVGYMPDLYKPEGLDRIIDVSAREAEETARALARAEGLFSGISGGGAVSAALRLAGEAGRDAVIVAVCPDRGDRYLSTGVFNATAGVADPAPAAAPELHSAIARLFAAAPVGPWYVLFRSAGGGSGAERAAAAATRAAVEGGGGKVLEVVVADSLQLQQMRCSLRRHFDFDVSTTPCLVSWGLVGPGSCMAADELLTAGSEAAAAAASSSNGAASATNGSSLGAMDDSAIRSFVRDTWDEFAPGGPADWGFCDQLGGTGDAVDASNGAGGHGLDGHGQISSR